MATSSQIRRINQRKIIQVMLRLRSASRAQLAKETGMSQATVGRIVDDLLGEAVMAEATHDVGGGGEGGGGTAVRQRKVPQVVQLGRPSTPLELDRRRRRFVTIHVGVHQTRMAALPIAVPQADEWTVEMPTAASPHRWIKGVTEQWDRVAGKGTEAIVISLPGVVDERQSRVLLSPNLRWTERADLAAMLRPLAPGAPVLFVQEIRALALGQLAADPHAENFLLVDFGSGVGAAAVIGGKLYRGALPLSGELGHTPVVGNTRRCGCGSVGCVETLVSRDGLLATARENGGPRGWGGLEAELEQGGLPEWLKPSLDATATTIAGGLNVLGLNRVVLTGSVEKFSGVGSYLRGQIARGAMWARFGEVTCTLEPRRRMAGLVTAAIDRVLLSDAHG